MLKHLQESEKLVPVRSAASHLVVTQAVQPKQLLVLGFCGIEQRLDRGSRAQRVSRSSDYQQWYAQARCQVHGVQAHQLAVALWRCRGREAAITAQRPACCLQRRQVLGQASPQAPADLLVRPMTSDGRIQHQRADMIRVLHCGAQRANRSPHEHEWAGRWPRQSGMFPQQPRQGIEEGGGVVVQTSERGLARRPTITSIVNEDGVERPARHETAERRTRLSSGELRVPSPTHQNAWWRRWFCCIFRRRHVHIPELNSIPGSDDAMLYFGGPFCN
mmetsp:Transcript_96001/g.311416  ORF Transcript_96001/g.311416 Transcript_96001/m.311416 type:complete len:275 (-) Transcript_96001:334-1158(-)